MVLLYLDKLCANAPSSDTLGKITYQRAVIFLTYHSHNGSNGNRYSYHCHGSPDDCEEWQNVVE